MQSLAAPNELYPFKGDFRIASRVVDVLIDNQIDLVITLFCSSAWFARRAKQVIAIGATDKARLASFSNVIKLDHHPDLVETLLPSLTNRRVLAYVGIEASADEIRSLQSCVALVLEQSKDFWKLIKAEFPNLVDRLNWQELLIPGPVPIEGLVQTCSREQFRLIYNGLKILSQVKVDSIDVAEQGNGDQAKVIFALAPLFSIKIGNFDLNPDGRKTYHIGLVHNDPQPLLLAGCCERVYECNELRELREGLPKFERSVRAWPLPSLFKPRERLVQCQLAGGLGNQLFQIATALHYAKQQTARAIFSLDVIGHRQDNWAQRLGLPCAQFQEAKIYKEPSFTYKPLPSFFDRITLIGYWQSDLYFDHEILTVLEPLFPEANSSRAVHVRRGDYINHPTVHPCASLEYYKEAIAKTSGELLFFSDDLDWCRAQFPDSQYAKQGDPLTDLLAMSRCETIIAANSTFSWWAGYLSRRGTQVCLPKVWFGPEGPDASDIYYNKPKVELEYGFLYRV